MVFVLATICGGGTGLRLIDVLGLTVKGLLVPECVLITYQ